MVTHHPGLTSLLVSLKDLFSVHCFSWYISRILIYVKDLSDQLYSNPKLFADDASLFSVVHEKNTSVKELNNDLQKISHWAYQWKMSFNHDRLRQAQEVIFSHKMTKTNHPTLIFNDNPVYQAFRLQTKFWRTS